MTHEERSSPRLPNMAMRPPGHESQHICVPILLWKADVATNGQSMFDSYIDILGRDAICCVDKESFVEDDAPADGVADTRRISFRGWMTFPVHQAYVSFLDSLGVVSDLQQSLNSSGSHAAGSPSGMANISTTIGCKFGRPMDNRNLRNPTRRVLILRSEVLVSFISIEGRHVMRAAISTTR